jgi:hypothetical protein
MARATFAGILLFVIALVFAPISLLSAQETAPNSAPDEVSSGTRFLISLQDPIDSKLSKKGDNFTALTLDRIISADGTALTPGAQVRGHIDRIEAAGKTGRAKLWLTFDDIRTPDGWLPVVAMVDDLPGVHSVRVDFNREGEIEAASTKRQEAMQAAAAGALVGAAPGIVEKSPKDAAMGAAAAAAAAYMVAAGLGQELTLERNTKIEVILQRPLHFGRT